MELNESFCVGFAEIIRSLKIGIAKILNPVVVKKIVKRVSIWKKNP